MNQIVRFPKKEEQQEAYKGEPALGSILKPGVDRKRFKLFPWLAGAVFISTLIYCSSYLALFWLTPYDGMDMKSQLTADYSTWSFLMFQPVDPAIIEEIRQERGLPEQVVLDGGSSSTPVATLTFNPSGRDSAGSTPLPTSDDTPSSPTNQLPAFTSTSIPTDIISPPVSTRTPQPTATAKTSWPRKPSKTPKPKTPNPNKPQDP